LGGEVGAPFGVALVGAGDDGDLLGGVGGK
jgi:hypothetical protein